jgi:hypothetical protein
VTHAITLTQLDRSSAAADQSVDYYADAWFENFPQTANLWFSLQTQNIPFGCEVWFQNINGNIRIAVPPTTVSDPHFQVGTRVDGVPANYQCRMRMYVQLNGRPWPPDAGLTLVVYDIQQPEGAETPAADQLVGTLTVAIG